MGIDLVLDVLVIVLELRTTSSSDRQNLTSLSALNMWKTYRQPSLLRRKRPDANGPETQTARRKRPDATGQTQTARFGNYKSEYGI
uniref:Uncharacterized protein n=1 Tax=Globodera rostochiensis TaxID=31243 RepID=A0A914I022_GLORO